MPILSFPGWRMPPTRSARKHPPHTRRLLAAIVLSLPFANAAVAQTSPSVLTLEAALDAAQARSAALQAQDAATRAAQEMAISAGRLPDPVLRLSVDNLPAEGPMRWSLSKDFMTQRSVELMQTFTAPEKRKARSARYEREAEATASLRDMQKARLLAQTASAWLDRHFQEQELGLLHRLREAYSRVSQAVESAYRGGRSSQQEVLEARAAIARIDDRMHETRAGLANAQALLQRWVGDAAAQSLDSPPDLHRTRLSGHQLIRQVDRHPEVAALEARERVALAQADVARQEKKADWSWSLMYSQRGSQFGDMVSFGVSVPLLWDQANKQDRELAARLRELEQVRLEREELRRERLLEVQRLITSWQNRLARLADYDKTLMPLSTQRVAATEAAFRGGQVPLAAVLEAHRMVIDTQLERLGIERQAAASWAELEFLIPPTQEQQP